MAPCTLVLGDEQGDVGHLLGVPGVPGAPSVPGVPGVPGVHGGLELQEGLHGVEVQGRAARGVEVHQVHRRVQGAHLTQQGHLDTPDMDC